MAETQPNQEWYQGVNLIGATGDVASEYIRRATEEDYPKGEHWPNPELKPEHNPINHPHPPSSLKIYNHNVFADFQPNFVLAMLIQNMTEKTKIRANNLH